MKIVPKEGLTQQILQNVSEKSADFLSAFVGNVQVSDDEPYA